MKAFVVSVIVLSLMLAMTIANAIYINNVTEYFITEAESLSPRKESVAEYTQKWEKHLPVIKISTSHKETHRIDETLEVLMAKAENGICTEFEEGRALLIEYLNQIKDDEQVSLDSII